MLVTKQLVVNIDFRKEKNTMEVNGYHQLFGHQYSSKYILCVCVQGKKEIHTRLEQHEGE